LALDLQSLDLAERRRAVTALHEIGPEAKEAAPALRLALRDPDGEVQMWAALTLINNQSYDKAEIPVLIAALQYDNSVVRQVVCLSLALIPYEEAEKQTVVAALTDTASRDVDGDVRQAAVSVLNLIVPDDVPQTGSK
jgi:HEAT repeat protein